MLHTVETAYEILKPPIRTYLNDVSESPICTNMLPEQLGAHWLPKEPEPHWLPKELEARWLPKELEARWLPEESEVCQLI
jgi:hypothetical protein